MHSAEFDKRVQTIFKTISLSEYLKLKEGPGEGELTILANRNGEHRYETWCHDVGLMCRVEK